VARWRRGPRGSLRSFAERVDVEAVVQAALVRVWQVAPRVRPDGRPEPLLRLCASTISARTAGLPGQTTTTPTDSQSSGTVVVISNVISRPPRRTSRAASGSNGTFSMLSMSEGASSRSASDA
jgi:hypothetical protein